jgi:hypothetical protein
MKRFRYIAMAVCALLLFSSSAWVKLTLIRPSEIVLPDHIKPLP